MATEAWKLISKVYYTIGFIFSSCQFVNDNSHKNQQNPSSSPAKETAVCQCWRFLGMLFFEKNNLYFKKTISVYLLIKSSLDKKDLNSFPEFWKINICLWKTWDLVVPIFLGSVFQSWVIWPPPHIQGEVRQYLETFLFFTSKGC